MWSFLSQFLTLSREPLTVVVVDREHTGPPQQHTVEPRRLLGAGLSLGAALMLLGGLVALTPPVRRVVFGSGAQGDPEAVRGQAERLLALEDSLRLQQEYIDRFRRLLSSERPVGEAATPVVEAEAGDREVPRAAPRPAARSREATAVAAVWSGAPARRLAVGEAGGLPLPAPAPVQGFVTREFDGRTGHLGVDIATGVGSVVRSVGDGFVIFADWTYEGGNTLAVQHADGYVSVYKHNEKLLHRLGERVRARDAVAVSGNTGEISTGPHLHFELWRDGLPQDPRAFVVGW